MKKYSPLALASLAIIFVFSFSPFATWQSRFVKQEGDKLTYIPDENGNIIPDFSRVGFYHGDRAIPDIAVVKTLEPGDDCEKRIQAAIDEVAAKPLDVNGYRGAVLIRKGSYPIADRIHITASGIVLKGEGNETKLIATGTVNRPLIDVSGQGNIKPAGARTTITDTYVPAGARSFHVAAAGGFKAGDRIIVYRPASEQWIRDLKMDQIDARDGTKQWQTTEYNLQYERMIVKVDGNTVFIDNPIVMPMEPKYGIPEIFKYTYEGRIEHVGVENICCESAYTSDTAENHSWNAVHFDKIENGWVRNVNARYFAYACVNLSPGAKNISVLNCGCFDHKSVITGGRRYSFNNDGQQNLFMNCEATDGRHDYVTGAKTCGPNVFYNCTAKKTHADIGPHHRWASGTLFDNIITDGEINVQDRGNWGSGHGWAGVTQVLWNCTAKVVCVQNPWVSGKNYCIGLQGQKANGRLKGRPDGIWEGQNQPGLTPTSLYTAQLAARRAEEKRK